MEGRVANLSVKVPMASEQVLKPSLGNWMSNVGLITMPNHYSYVRIFEKICNFKSFVSIYTGYVFVLRMPFLVLKGSFLL